jgi:hypothetical protein
MNFFWYVRHFRQRRIFAHDGNSRCPLPLQRRVLLSLSRLVATSAAERLRGKKTPRKSPFSMEPKCKRRRRSAFLKTYNVQAV